MAIRIPELLNKRYPQNFMIRNPLLGVMIFLALITFFVIVYKPSQVRESRFFNPAVTIIIYNLLTLIPLFVLVKLLRRSRFFSNPDEWTILKELLSALIILGGMGVIIYFIGFIMEVPSVRWNLRTFFNSVLIASLIGLVPFMFFTIINYRYLLVVDTTENYTLPGKPSPVKKEELIKISSQLKKEELTFFPDQFIYAESDGNYTIFYLDVEGRLKKRIIRNSISNIEQQLTPVPYFFRTHRAFIINIKKVTSRNGNTLGYRLKLTGPDNEIPVSRQKTRDFDQLMKKFF